jgi:hypothetical protein
MPAFQSGFFQAGLNAVLEALAQGVPQVAIPVTNDKRFLREWLTSSHGFHETTRRSLTRRYFLDSEGLQRVCVKACGYAKAMVDLIERECSPCIRAEEPIDHAVVVS